MNPADTAAASGRTIFFLFVAIFPLCAHTYTSYGYIITTPPTVYSHAVRPQIELIILYVDTGPSGVIYFQTRISFRKI